MGAIAPDGVGTIEHECIKCFDCLKNCNYDAVSFTFTRPSKVKSIEHPGKGITRRDLLIVAGSSAMVAASKVSLFAASHDSSIIRPPGALRESQFLDALYSMWTMHECMPYQCAAIHVLLKQVFMECSLHA